MDPWHENDGFWTAIEAALFNPERLEMAPKDIDGVIKLLGIEPGERVLDLCCGPGRHAVELARRGYSVVGVDRNPRYLKRAQAAGEEVEFVEGDMREFVRAGEFDAVINLYTSFGYFEERKWSEQGGAHLLQESRPVDDWSWVESRWILVREGKEKEFTVRVRLYAATELKAMLRSVGFGKVEVFGSLDGAPYDHKAERLVAVAR